MNYADRQGTDTKAQNIRVTRRLAKLTKAERCIGTSSLIIPVALQFYYFVKLATQTQIAKVYIST